ncbi:MAG TPA: hypothetical protein VMV50_01070 [Candidatus Paceibacterota bacterium]|nr:hypothetical protein [Candidatus Paceibacterota bacterium]
MITALKRLIDRTTMYRLVLYYLVVLYVVALAFGVFGILPYAPVPLLYTLIVLVAGSWATNLIFANIFDAVTNAESSLITGLILVLILPPISAGSIGATILYALIAAAGTASKYIFSLGNKHVFNPAAFAVAFSAFVFAVNATWWVSGNLPLLPFVVIGGLAIVHKLRRYDLVIAFGVAALLATAFTSLSPVTGLNETILHSAFFFLGFVMLTEPLTMPPSRTLRIIYGALVGVLFVPAAHVGSFYFTPETALLAGNLFSYVVSPKGRYMLTLTERHKLARGIYEFVFRPDRPFTFRPGQYLEWTLRDVPFDSRGNRRYFTIASAPEDGQIRLGVRFYEKPSAFKRALAAIPQDGVVTAASLSGDFTMPVDKNHKLAFIAGGVGVTPFASMARHLVAAGESRDAVLLYSSRTAEEVAYQDVFASAATRGLRTVYAITDSTTLMPGAHAGAIDAAFIKREIPDYRNRLFYLSGPPGMVDAMKRALHTLGVPRLSIKTDYFPGLA